MREEEELGKGLTSVSIEKKFLRFDVSKQRCILRSQ